ncbi:MAG: MerR family transcriptional regulator [Bifidobacteriaceae bacterium]|jgi:MerR family transcriptional regulator/heat shock protein HspR|nr:MerR family transcriptional regulator [Bifidobacteriaceae bacterium]
MTTMRIDVTVGTVGTVGTGGAGAGAAVGGFAGAVGAGAGVAGGGGMAGAGARASGLPGSGLPGSDSADAQDVPIYPIGVAAHLAEMHPQTLRQYDRLGLVVPRRAAGRGRRYSARDIATLREVQRLSTREGVNLAGIARILALEAENRELRRQVEALRAAAQPGHRVFAVAPTGDAVPLSRGQRPARPARPVPDAASRAIILWRG